MLFLTQQTLLRYLGIPRPSKRGARLALQVKRPALQLHKPTLDGEAARPIHIKDPPKIPQTAESRLKNMNSLRLTKPHQAAEAAPRGPGGAGIREQRGGNYGPILTAVASHLLSTRFGENINSERIENTKQRQHGKPQKPTKAKNKRMR